MPLFQKSVLKSQLEKLDDDLIQQSWEAYKSYFLNSIIQDSIINVKEEEFQSDLISNDNMKWKEIEFYNTQNQILSEGEGKFVILNWAKPNNMSKMLEIQNKVENHFKKNMNKYGMTGWGFATAIAPQGKNFSTALFWDVYDSFEGVLSHLNNQAVNIGIADNIKNEFNQIVPDGWDSRVIFQIIATTK